MALDARRKELIRQHGPEGWWRTAAGSADALGVDDVVFYADGSGTITERSVLDGTETTEFMWKMLEPGVLGLLVPADAGPGEPPYWRRVPLAFRVKQTDVGDIEVMYEDGSDGFWWLIDPLCWIDEAPEREGVADP